MLYRYGQAVVQERTEPAKHAAVATYVRWEYGAGNGVAQVLAEDGHRSAPGNGRRHVFRRAARAVRALVSPNRSAKQDHVSESVE